MQDQMSTTQETSEKIDFNAFVPASETVGADESQFETEETDDDPGAQQEETQTTQTETETPQEPAATPETPAQPDATTETTDTAQPQQPSWEELVKAQNKADVLAQLGDKTEILKELGISDFVISLHQFMENGGDVKKYLRANANDYSTMSDDDVILEGIRLEEPNASEKVIARLYKKEMEKYGFDPDVDDEDEKEYAEFQKKKKADEYRSKLLENQKQFTVPPVKEKSSEDASKQEAERLTAEQQQKQFEEGKNKILGSEQTKKLLTEKIVTTSQGYRFEVPNSQDLVDMATGEKSFLSQFLKEDGTYDLDHWFAVTAFATNRQNYENALINYGKTKAIKETIEEDENPIQRDASRQAAPVQKTAIQLLNEQGREFRN